MPIYDFYCSFCGHKAEIFQSSNDASLKFCSECGKETFTKQLSAVSFNIKGGVSIKNKVSNSGNSGCGSGGCGCH